jgi:hypothetical protein
MRAEASPPFRRRIRTAASPLLHRCPPSRNQTDLIEAASESSARPQGIRILVQLVLKSDYRLQFSAALATILVE